MSTDQTQKTKDRFVRVKDRQGNEFICSAKALKKFDELTEEEKSKCVEAVSPRGLVSPL